MGDGNPEEVEALRPLATDRADPSARSLAPFLGRREWLRRESAAVRAHARRSSQAALFLRYLRLHSPPPPRPPASGHTALAETPPTSLRRVERVTSHPPSQPSPSVTIGHLRDALPPTAKVGWRTGKEVGEERG